MSGRRRGIRWLIRWRRSGRRDIGREVDEEIQLHIELRAEELMAGGMAPERARQEARRLFAVRDETLETLRDNAVRRSHRLRFREQWGEWWRDAVYAARGVMREPSLAGFVVVALALAIGGAVTAYSIVDRVLLRDPAHVVGAGRLVRLYGTVAGAAGARTSSYIPYHTYLGMRDGLARLGDVAAYQVVPQVVGQGVDARSLQVGRTLGDFFATLGTEPYRGRLYTGAEGRAGEKLALVSDRLWRGQWGGPATPVGGTVTVAGEPYTVVGVAPPDFAGLELHRVDLWITVDAATAGTTNWNEVVRMRPGVSPAAVAAQAAVVAAHTADGLPRSFRWFAEATVDARPIRYDATGRLPFEATMARWLAAIALVILLVAFGNVMNLSLARLGRRRRKLAVRQALGSGRSVRDAPGGRRPLPPQLPTHRRPRPGRRSRPGDRCPDRAPPP